MLSDPIPVSLDYALEYIVDDELVEVRPLRFFNDFYSALLHLLIVWVPCCGPGVSIRVRSRVCMNADVQRVASLPCRSRLRQCACARTLTQKRRSERDEPPCSAPSLKTCCPNQQMQTSTPVLALLFELPFILFCGFISLLPHVRNL